MGLLTPLALAFAALSIPLVLLYMLKLRRQDVLVSSTLLWQRLLRDREANAPWQRLRRNLLLLLQLLILALLTLALARPFAPTHTVVSGSVVVLLDASASMQAGDGAPTRFDAARQATQDWVDGLQPGDVATLIAVGPQPQVLAAATGDRAALRRALQQAAPSDGAANWPAALALAAAAAAGSRTPQTVILSDGAISEPLPALPGTVRFVRLGQRGDNLAVVTLAVREGSSGPQALLRVANSGDAAVETAVELRADGLLLDIRPLVIPADRDVAVALDDLPYDLTVLEARLAAGDPLPLDDVAWAVRSRAATRRVLLVTPGNLFLERALELQPGLEITRLAPDQPIPAEEYDLIVRDGPLTATLPAGNLWAIGPYGTLTGTFTNTAVVRSADDPLLRYVDLGDVHVARAWRVEPPPGARVLVEAAGGPLLLVAERPEGRLALLTFQLYDSDLPLQVAFPILVANLSGWLLPQSGLGDQADVSPGAPVTIQTAAEAARVVVSAPDGSRQVLPVGPALPVYAAERLGVYRVEQMDAQDTLLRVDMLAVNLFDPAESDIAPQETIRVGQSEVDVAQQEQEGRREFWPWLAGLGLAVLGVEWWVFYRGQASRSSR